MKKAIIKMIRMTIFLAVLASFAPMQEINAAGFCYVNSNVVGGTNNGTSWSNAYTNLQSAIADTCTEIWVAAGTYKPHASDRAVSFTLENGVAIYGGFDGAENLRSERDYLTNITTLSGDLLGNDSGFTNNTENSYHVVIGSGTNNTAILDGFTIKGGNADTNPGLTGGGVYNFEGNPTFANIIITGNIATAQGGGIYNSNSNPSLTNITVSGNTAEEGGGMYNLDSAPTLLNISFSYNSASNSGGAIYNNNSNVSITDSSITNNSAGIAGGGMTNSQSNPSLTNVSFTNNSALIGGGLNNSNESAATLTNVSFLTNTATSFSGGGIQNSNSSPVLTNVTFTNNQALSVFGGGMYSEGASNLTLIGVTFNNNSALRGGGMYIDNTGVVQITNTTFKNNSSTQDGGGLFNAFGATTTIINSTFYGNSVTDEGGAVYNSGALTIKNGTISKSRAVEGGGVFNLGTLNYSNTIIANTTAGGDCFSFPVISTNIKNLVEDGSCSAALTGDPILGSLANNGGSTQTMALLMGSPAINAGDNATCAAAPVDNQSQNGVTRPQGMICDIGAVEIPMSLYSSTFKSNAANDGWILESSEFRNTGGSMNSSATNLILGDDAADKQYRVILHFDTSALPDIAAVTSMTLKIKQQGNVTGTSPFSFGSLYVDMRNPAFGGNALDLADFNFAAKKVKSAVFNPNPDSGWFSARFNNGGNLYVNRTGTTQLRLYFSLDDNNNNIADFIRFFSGNAAGGDRPKLLIQYYAP